MRLNPWFNSFCLVPIEGSSAVGMPEREMDVIGTIVQKPWLAGLMTAVSIGWTIYKYNLVRRLGWKIAHLKPVEQHCIGKV